MTEAPPLWEHQERALRELDALIGDEGGAMLDAYMGTGKTRTALEFVRRRKLRRVLVLAPLSVVPVWTSQSQQWSPDLRVLPLHKGSTKARAGALRNALAMGGDILVSINYDAAWRGELGDLLRKQEWDILILDEVHRIKSPGGKASRWCGRLSASCTRRLGMTGTLMPHGPLDVYGQFRTVEPLLFGHSFVRFRALHAVMGGFEGHQVIGYQRMDELKAKIARRSVFVDRSVLTLLPAQHVEIPVDLPPKARKTYDSLKDEMVAQIDAGEITVSNAMVKMLRLQQITGGHIQLDDEETPRELHTAKGDALADILDGLPIDEPVVVFARFTHDLEIIARAATKAGRGYRELSGRVKELDIWTAGVLGVQIQAGGVGVDLTRAAVCVYYSLGYSLGDYEQSLARCHRPGQERHVTYYHLIASGTVDRAVYQSLSAKGQVIEDVMGSLRRGEFTTTEK